jgi:hypothetical protein
MRGAVLSSQFLVHSSWPVPRNGTEKQFSVVSFSGTGDENQELETGIEN